MELMQDAATLAWVATGLRTGLIILGAAMILASLVRLARVGPRAYFRTAFQLDPETWRLVGILLLVGFVALAMFR